MPSPHMHMGEEEVEQDGDGELVVTIHGGRRYLTPAPLATIQQTQEDLKLHMEGQKLDLPTEKPKPTAESRSKPAKLDRPKLEQDMSEQEQVDQLWGCLSPGMKRAAAGDGLELISDPTTFLSRVKVLAVKKHNPLVAQVRFLSSDKIGTSP